MEQSTQIIAIITTKQDAVKAVGAPVFITPNRESLQNVSSTLEKNLDASAHEVDEDTMIIVLH